MHVLESVIQDCILNICIDFGEHAWHNTGAEELRDKIVNAGEYTSAACVEIFIAREKW